MKRRIVTTGKAGKTARPKTATKWLRAANPALASAVPTRQETEIGQLRSNLHEALERQAATTAVLKTISSSRGDLGQVFEAILENATRICEADFGILYRFDEGVLRAVVLRGAPPEFAESQLRAPIRPSPGTGLDRIISTRRPVHIVDVRREQPYKDGDPYVVTAVKLSGSRSLVLVPMVREDDIVGAITIYRKKIRPFTDRQIDLVQSFAAQAVIAIENARLLNELRESLDQQTATAGVLRVISSSPGELEPVFRSILDNATRICQANFGTLFLREGEALRVAAHHGSLTKAWDEQWRVGMLLQPDAELQAFQTLSARQPIQVADLSKAASYLARNPKAVNSVEIGGIRTMVTVPMLKDGEAIGVITIFRTEIRELTEKQIALLTNFAAQAVIAIENTRLLGELRELLEQQTATSEVLGVISSSPGELEPVFQAMLANAVRICDSKFGTLFRYDDETFEAVALFGTPPELTEFHRKRGRFRPVAGAGLERVARSKDVVRIADERAEPTPSISARVAGARSVIVVPMLKDNELIGAISIYRGEVRPFTEKQIALVTNFAAQAVIAIENTRLLSELRESLQQQTATADVLKVISSSPGELKPVFQAMLENATCICEAKFGTLFHFNDHAYHLAAQFGTPPDLAEFQRHRGPFQAPPGGHLDQITRTKQVRHTADEAADPHPGKAATLGGARSAVYVPMLKDDQLIGAIVIYRQEVRPFTDKQIELVQNFAAQAVIAIENTRLLNELRQRTTDLSKSLENLRTAQDRLVQTEKLASLGQLTAGIAHEIKNPLNFVNNFSSVSIELIDELREALAGVQLDDKRRTEIAEIADMLQGNLDKVVQHGKRADSIVKNMLLHSREGSGEHRAVDINALVEESLNLAYHGARAEKQGFNIALERSFDPAAGEVDLFPQEITRVLLNLISNGFYAATKRKAQTDGSPYEPTLTAATKNLGDRVEIRIRDNGAGIPAEVREKIFNPFFTTKPAGEGTGLGLSISHDIIVKQHAGTIEVETETGHFTEFKIVLPRAGASLIPSGEHA